MIGDHIINQRQKLADAIRILYFVEGIGEAIRGVGRVPSGHLYAQVMGKMTLEQYERVIGILKGTKLIKEESNDLIWIGKNPIAERKK